MMNKEKLSVASGIDVNCNPQRKIFLPYVNPTPGELPIMSSGKLPGFTFFNKEYLQLIKECGINIVQSMIGTAGRGNSDSSTSTDSDVRMDVECTYEGEAKKQGFVACGFGKQVYCFTCPSDN